MLQNLIQIKQNKIFFQLLQTEKGWRDFKVKTISSLLIGITSKHKVNFYFMNCFRSFTRKNKLESHKSCKPCENKDFCNVVMSSEDTRLLEFT